MRLLSCLPAPLWILDSGAAQTLRHVFWTQVLPYPHCKHGTGERTKCRHNTRRTWAQRFIKAQSTAVQSTQSPCFRRRRSCCCRAGCTGACRPFRSTTAECTGKMTRMRGPSCRSGGCMGSRCCCSTQLQQGGSGRFARPRQRSLEVLHALGSLLRSGQPCAAHSHRWKCTRHCTPLHTAQGGKKWLVV